jgi:hypothetical protein
MSNSNSANSVTPTTLDVVSVRSRKKKHVA